MKIIRYIEIENFKTFGENVHIDLGHPAVLIGPNNAGKTSVIQALALWSRGIKDWFDKKGQPRQKEKRERLSVGINRLNILEIPVSQTRSLWKSTRVRKANTPIELTINVGMEHEGQVKNCRLIFKQRDSELIYCKPCPETVKDDGLLSHAAQLQFNLLYPMSGIVTEETLIQEGRINVLMGQGQTAEVLRNLCYKVFEDDPSTNDWKALTKLIKKLFSINLDKPQFNKSRGTIQLQYKQEEVDNKLDISLAGRGLQQMLLMLAYLYSHKGSILLIDEPDAHLEILRQKQVYEVLKEIALDNNSQVIIATHSEVILEDAIDTNLTLLINGEAINLAKRQDIKNSLKIFGIEHYYKAKVMPRILYVEGSTDIEVLKAFASKLDHPAYDVLSGKINYYYTQDINPEDTLDSRLDRASGAFKHYRKHFETIKNYVAELKGIAIFDNDGRNRDDEITDNLAVVHWANYEIENYFITPDIILHYIDDIFEKERPLFKNDRHKIMEQIIDQWLLKEIFDEDTDRLAEFYNLSKSLQRNILRGYKMSSFAEKVFLDFAKETNEPILLNKGEFYQLIEYMQKEDIPKEVPEKLELIVKYLDFSETLH